MEQKHFREVDGKLAFNTQNAKPIFIILNRSKLGFTYFHEDKPFGPVNFVWKDNVVEEKKEEKSGK